MAQTGDDNLYHRLLDLPADLTDPDWYQLLGIPRFTSDIRRIHEAAVARNTQLRRWDNSQFYREADQLTNEVAQASLVLENPAKKASYDQALRQRLGMAPASKTVVEPPSAEETDAPPVQEPTPHPRRRRPKTESRTAPEPAARPRWALVAATAAASLVIALGLAWMIRGRQPAAATTSLPAPIPAPSPPPVAKTASLALAPLPAVTLQPGGRADIPLRLERVECPGVVQVQVAGKPDWLTVEPCAIADGQSAGTLQLTIGSTAPIGAETLVVEAAAGQVRTTQQLGLVVESLEIGKWSTTGRIVSLSAQGGRVLAGSNDSLIHVWDLQTGGQLLTRPANSGDVRGVDLSADGQLAVFGGADGTLRLWALDQLPQVSERYSLPGHRTYITGVAISADGRIGISGSDDLTVRVWDLAAGAERSVLAGHSAGVTCVAISPDGRFAVSGGHDKTVRLWDLEQQSEIWDAKIRPRPERHGRSVTSVGISASGDVVVSGSRDGVVKIWTFDASRQTEGPVELRGHAGGVASVAISADARLVLSGGDDQFVRLWDVRTGRELNRYAGHTAPITSVAFTANGNAVSSSADLTLRIWKLPGEAANVSLSGSGQR